MNLKSLDLKMSVWIVFGGALLVLLMVKATSVLLPAKYYFNFSTLIGGRGDLLLVDPPSISYGKLCDILNKHGIEPEKTFRQSFSCAGGGSGGTLDDIDRIYTIALRSDPTVRAAFADAIQRAGLQHLSDQELADLAAGAPSSAALFDAIFDRYRTQITELAPRDVVSELYKSPPADAAADGADAETPDPANRRVITPDERSKIVQAYNNVRDELTVSVLAQNLRPMRKSALDRIVDPKGDDIGGDIPYRITNFYVGGVLDGVKEVMTRRFAALGLPAGKDYQLRVVFDEINKFYWKDYIISILLRLTPVFLFGLVAGAALGRGELFSIALAAGLAAFLLSWPLMLLWERLVRVEWADKRNLYLVLHASYIISFFVTARSAALLGTWLREHAVFAGDAWSLPQGPGGLRVTWRQVATNVGAAAVLNIALYTWNLYVPINMASP